jgi:hypothetical protein
MPKLNSDLPDLSDRIPTHLLRFPLRRHLTALLFTAPALAAALALQSDLPFSTMMFIGGDAVFFKNLCQAALFPYFGLCMLALGTLFLPAPSYTKNLQHALLHRRNHNLEC